MPVGRWELSRRNHARGNAGLTLDARLYVSLTAPEYTGSLYVGTSRASRRLLFKEARCIGTITAPIALYSIAHRAGKKKKKTEEANLWMYEASDFSSRDVSIYEIACIFSFFNRYIVYWWHRVFLHIFHAKNVER